MYLSSLGIFLFKEEISFKFRKKLIFIRYIDIFREFQDFMIENDYHVRFALSSRDIRNDVT